MKLYWKIIIGVIAAIIIGGVALYLLRPTEKGLTVKEFESRMVDKLNKQLADPQNETRSAIAKLNNATTIHYVKVTGIECTTIDGSQHVGKNGKKIHSIKARITAKWENSTHKGMTVLAYESTRSADGNLTTPSCTVKATATNRKNSKTSTITDYLTPQVVQDITRLVTVIIITLV